MLQELPKAKAPQILHVLTSGATWLCGLCNCVGCAIVQVVLCCGLYYDVGCVLCCSEWRLYGYVHSITMWVVPWCGFCCDVGWVVGCIVGCFMLWVVPWCVLYHGVCCVVICIVGYIVI